LKGKKERKKNKMEKRRGVQKRNLGKTRRVGDTKYRPSRCHNKVKGKKVLGSTQWSENQGCIEALKRDARLGAIEKRGGHSRRQLTPEKKKKRKAKKRKSRRGSK